MGGIHVNFHQIRDGGVGGVACADLGGWASSPFTVRVLKFTTATH
jgi:hypothetical protein